MLGESTKTVWYKISYKLPKNYVAGAALGTIPGFYGSKNAGFFVPAQNQTEALARAKQGFSRNRKKYGEHAFSAAQVNMLDLKIKRLSKDEAMEEELGFILEKHAKKGDTVYLHNDVYTVIRVKKRDAEKQFPSEYLPKNIKNWDEVRSPDGQEVYTVVKY